MNKENFMFAYFDSNISDLAPKQKENIKFQDSFKIFKVNKNDRRTEKNNKDSSKT